MSPEARARVEEMTKKFLEEIKKNSKEQPGH